MFPNPCDLKPIICESVDTARGPSGAAQVGGGRGGTYAGVTPALDTPFELPDNKSISLKNDRKRINL